MQFNDTVLLAASRDRVWQTLNDPQKIGRCIPGLETVEIYEDGRAFGGQARINVGSSALSFPTRVTWVEQDAPHGGSLRATAVLAGYNIEGQGAVRLTESRIGETTLNWDVDVVIPDTLAKNPLMIQMANMFATRFIKGFFQCVQARLEAV